MPTRKAIKRILKFLGKAILGILLLFILLLLVAHLPSVQQRIKHRLVTFLTEKTKGRVEIEKLDYSIFGNVRITGLQVWDPGSNLILSAGKIEATSNMLDLLSGKYTFGKIAFEDVKAKVIENETGLNIQFIMDAFQPKTTQPKDTSFTDINLLCRKLILKNIDFEYESATTGTDFKINLGNLSGDEAGYSTLSNAFSADSIHLDVFTINMLEKNHQDTTIDSTRNQSFPEFSPDFGIGIGLVVQHFEIKQGNFSYHENEVVETSKFDPAHLEFNNIHLRLHDVVMNPETLSAKVSKSNVQLPGFMVKDARAAILMNRHSFSLSSFHLSSVNSEVNADLTATYDLMAVETPSTPNIILKANSILDPTELAYFFSDDQMKYVLPWKTTELAIDTKYKNGVTDLYDVKVKTGNSQLSAKGIIQNVFDPHSISWQDLNIKATLGSDFKSTMTPFIRDLKVPSSMKVQFNTTGNLKKIFVDGNVLSPWGNATTKGTVLFLQKDIVLDLNVTGHRLQLNEYSDLPWLGMVDFSGNATGKIGNHQDAQIDGVISSIVLMDKPIHQVAFQGRLEKDRMDADFQIDDPDYRMHGHTKIDYAQPMLISGDFHFDTFQLGQLVSLDSILSITGDLIADMTIDGSDLESQMHSSSIALSNGLFTYRLDTLAMTALLSPDTSSLNYYTDNSKGSLMANFDLQQLPDLLQPWMKNILSPSAKIPLAKGHRSIHFDLEFNNPAPLKFMGFNVAEFSNVHAIGKLNEADHSIEAEINSGKWIGYDVSLDSLRADIILVGDSIGGTINGKNIIYNSLNLGSLDFGVMTARDTMFADLALSHDTVAYLGIGTRILRTADGATFYPNKLSALNKFFLLDPTNAIFVNDSNIVVSQFQISHDSMQLNLSGDLHSFHADFRNLDLIQLNPLLSSTEKVINNGVLNGTFIYERGNQIHLKANIDSLQLYHSVPLTVTLSTVKEQDLLPFEFQLSNENNMLDISGNYKLNEETVDASMNMDISNPEMFAFLYSAYIKKMNGSIKGNATIHGPLETPAIKGNLRFHDFNFTTTSPDVTLYVKDDSISMDNEGLSLDQFKLYDSKQHPLLLSGKIITKDLPLYKYDLTLKANDFDLVDKPVDSKSPLRGLLALDSDITLSGNEKDTYVNATINIRNNTDLIYVMESDNDVLQNTIGIVEFVAPDQLTDTLQLATSETAYDSLVASLPDFNLTSRIVIQDSATLKVVTDEQSGDYFQASGGADLDLTSDRTGNPNLSGIYTINKGVYRMSFYDLVKKTFTIEQGSSIHWSGSPENGDIDILATYIVATNSLGLIGHEIGDNEKSIYKRSLDYIVGIKIKGTLEKPIITFALDLAKADRTSFPVLANKLDRLRQPEYQTELNKQVFGLLVLGGFMPETTGTGIDESQVATTAIYNSVNALLASQVNRFASQYVKGVDIDVGIQSYSDYSTPGGKTQTAMDFRVSKSVFNDRLSFEVGGDFDINSDQTGTNKGNNYRGDVAIIYDLTGNGDKQLKLFNNESYDIIYQEIRNTGISLIFIREFNKGDKLMGKAARVTARAERKAKAEAEAREKKKAKVEGSPNKE